jgi:hypothetical protein
MQQDWVEHILQLCTDTNIPFFFKHWGGVHKTKAGRALHGRTFDDLPERDVAPIPAREVRLDRMSEWRQRAALWKPELAQLSPSP